MPRPPLSAKSAKWARAVSPPWSCSRLNVASVSNDPTSKQNDNGDGFLVRDNLPGLSADRTYQVWAILGDKPVSVGVLGDVVLGRLALQSVALGYDQPLTGYWVAEPEGPRILRVRSGDNEVAEFYDRDRNDRVEVLYVVQPIW